MPGVILVVDDQDVVRDVVRIALENAGYRVLESSSPSGALEIVGSEPIDLLITDVVMPEMDAFELAQRVEAAVPGVRILYTSGYTDARDEGPFLQKPFTPAELVDMVAGLLAGT